MSGLPRHAEDRLTRFVLRWRENFVARAAPRAMPASWTPNYRVFQAGLRRGQCEPPLVREVMAAFGLNADGDAAHAGAADDDDNDDNDDDGDDHDDDAAGDTAAHSDAGGAAEAGGTAGAAAAGGIGASKS